MIPMNDVTANPMGIVNSCDHSASRGFLEKREKSGSLLKRFGRHVNQAVMTGYMVSDTYTMSVAKLAMDDIIPLTIPQARSLPWIVLRL